MSDIVQIRRTEDTSIRYIEVIVPSEVASVGFDYDGAYGVGPTGPANMAAFVDKYVTPDLNRVHSPGSVIERKANRLGGRAIIFCLPSSPLLSTAPVLVSGLVASVVSGTPESYAIHSVPGGDFWLIAKRGEGFRHAAFDLLARLSVKYYGAHPAWKRISSFGLTSLNLSEFKTPVIRDFLIAGNGGLGNGNVNFAGALQDKQFSTDQFWYDWFAQRRFPRELGGPGSDGTEAFTYRKQRELAHDSTQRAWSASLLERGANNGLGSPNPHYPTQGQDGAYPFFSKNCYSHHGLTAGGVYPARPGTATPWTTAPNAQSGPTSTVGVTYPDADPNPDSATPPNALDYTSHGGLTKLHAEHLRDSIAARINTFGTDSPFANRAFTSTNDGSDECDCQKCKDLLRNGPYSAYLTPAQRAQDSSYSDRVFHGHNTAVQFLNYWFGTSTTVRPGGAASAYSDHTAVPSIPIEANSTIYVVESTDSTNTTLPELFYDWGQKRATNPLGQFLLGIEPHWLISNSVFDLPRLSAHKATSDLQYWVGLGFQGFSAQTSYSNIALGAIYYTAAELCWNADADTEALITDWFTVFGAAAVAVRTMLERHWQWFELSPHEIGQCFRDVQSAQTALSADTSATVDQQTCLDHVAAWVQWLRLFLEYQTASVAYNAAHNPTTLSALDTSVDNALSWLWNVKPFNIVMADRLAKSIYVTIPGTETALLAKWNTASSGGSGWATVTEPTHSALVTAMAAGATAYPLLSGVTRHSYSTNLVAYTTSVDATLVWTPFCDHPNQYMFVKHAGTLTFSCKQLGLTDVSGPVLPLRIRVLDPVTGATLQVIESLAPAFGAGIVTTTHTITVAAGTYILDVADLGANANQMQLGFARSVPLVMMAPAVLREFNQTPYPDQHFYFYVPLGTTRDALVYQGLEAPVVYDNTGTPVTLHHEGLYSYWFDVPSGHDGALWSWTKIQVSPLAADGATPHLEVSPSFFGLDPAQMMVPSGLDGFF